MGCLHRMKPRCAHAREQYTPGAALAFRVKALPHCRQLYVCLLIGNQFYTKMVEAAISNKDYQGW